MPRIDMHSHILPQLDDGAKSVEDSIQMLKLDKADGVDVIVATPHFYRQNTTLNEFLEKRQLSYQKLCSAINNTDKKLLPEIVLGAEVYFTPSLLDENLDAICIGNTDYLLLELPYRSFTRSLLNNVRDFISACPKSIVLAHIERYFDFADAETISDILSIGVSCQVNCDLPTSFLSKRNTVKLLESGDVVAIGTDCHNLTDRAPNFSQGEVFIRKKASDRAFEAIMEASEKILANRSI